MKEEEEKRKEPPQFVSKPEPVTVREGDLARFCCRVTGFPRPRVMWVVNGNTVVNVSTCTPKNTNYQLITVNGWSVCIVGNEVQIELRRYVALGHTEDETI